MTAARQESSAAGKLSDPLWLYLGRWLERKGVPALAESCFRNAAGGSGKLAVEANFRLSQQLLAASRNREAAETCEKALALEPGHARLWCALGAARRRLAQMDGAREAYEKAVAIDPDYAQAWSNLGEWWLVKGDWAAALTHFDRALEFDPRLHQALNNRAAALYELGRFAEAESAARAAIALHADEAAMHVNLGNVLLHTGKARPAFKCFKRALECDPGCPEAHLALATMLGETARLADALAFLEHEIAVKGESAQRLATLALALQAKGDWPGAERTCHKVLELQPTNVAALITLAGCHSARADHRGAIELHRKALAINPAMPAIHSNIAFDSTYLPDLSADEVFALHREWEESYGKAGGAPAASHAQGADPDRPLRIGYVSGDFGTHPVGFLLRDVIRHHDRERFRIHCYSMMRAEDDITRAIRQAADSWVDALLMSDDELCEQVRADAIDILVDLAGHTAYNRLPVFARKPAPVQATWIGYFHSTGLAAIDYFITDPVTSPEGGGQRFSEAVVRLPHSRFCYSPPEYSPAIAAPPSVACGRVTFGSFNRIEKLVDPVLEAWARIVNAVPGSRLMLKAGTLENEEMGETLRRRFGRAGLAADRLELRRTSSHPEMLFQYGEVDIALDPFPFNGGMTTMEALWMGVPVVCLAGAGVVSRQSASALANVGLPELVFPDLEAYVKGAVELAGDPERLARLRRELRPRMERSPLCQSDQFAADLELLYRRMWQAWCRGERLGPEPVAAAPVKTRTVLHVGCGAANIRSLPAFFQARWKEIRLDIDETVEPDILGTVLDMSAVPSGSVDAVYSSHTLEHLYAHELPLALAEMRRVLKPDGMMVSTVPDLQSAARMIAEDRLFDTAYLSPAGPITPFDILYSYRGFVGRDRPYMAHHGGFTLTTLKRSVEEAGFPSVTGNRREAAFDLWVLATRSPVAPEALEKLASSVLPR